MIKYRLTCAEGHDFESWFASGADYDRLNAGGLLSCIVCGGSKVKKGLMAPQVAANESPLTQPASPAEQALRAIREKVERESEDVGKGFAAEARRIHDGEAPERSIHGQAKGAEVRSLIEDGVPVLPLPWGDKKAN